MKIVNKSEFSEITKSEKLTLVDFFADWCGPCQMLSPVLEDILKEHSDKVEIVKVDVDESQDLAQEFEVSSIPTLIFFKGSIAVDKLTGFQSKDALVAKINELA